MLSRVSELGSTTTQMQLVLQSGRPSPGVGNRPSNPEAHTPKKGPADASAIHVNQPQTLCQFECQRSIGVGGVKCLVYEQALQMSDMRPPW